MDGQYDVFAQQEAIARRRKLMDAMTGQNLQTPIVGDTGLGQALAKLGTSYLLQKGGKKLDAEDTQNRQQYGNELSSELGTYMDARGKDPKAAILKAMTSRYPELRQTAAADLKVGERKPQVVNNKLVDVDPATGRPTVLGDYSDQFDPPERRNIGGKEIEVQRNKSTGKYHQINGGTNVEVNNGSKGNEFALKKMGEVLEGARTEQLNARKTIQSADRVMALAQDPEVVTGFAAGLEQGLMSAGAKLGIVGPEAATKTQALVSELAQQTLAAQQHLKGPTSDKDIMFLKEAAGGNINYTPEALQYLAGLAKAVAHNQALEARDQWQSAATVDGAGDFVKMFPQPNLGTWAMDENMFGESDRGRVVYKGNQVTRPAQAPASVPGASPKPTPRNAPLDSRIKFSDLPPGR